MADVGTGATITFATSGFAAKIMSFTGPSFERPSIDKTHLADTVSRKFMPGDLYDAGELGIEFQFDPQLTPPISGAVETVTITWPVPSGLTNAGTWAFSGFMTNYQVSTPLEDLMTASATVKITGSVTIVAAT